MQNFKRWLLLIVALVNVLHPLNTPAEDIDIFTGVSAGAAERPNVLIVLDNTSNWARQNQKWPGGLSQGQAEVRSIERVLDVIGTDINVGVMEFVTNGNAGNTGGFVRFPISQMDATNKAALKAEMQEIFNDINGNDEKRNSGTPYGNLMYDVYNYLAGLNVGPNSSGLNPPSAKVNPAGYDTLYSNFKTPLSSANSCAKNYVIFIGNPSSSGPSTDTATNRTELASLGCSTTNIPLPNFISNPISTDSNLGNTTTCYADAASCTTAVQAEYASQPAGDVTYSSVRCDSPVAPETSCPNGTLRFSVLATDNAGNKNLGSLSSCVQNAGKCADAIQAQYGDLCQGNGVSCSCTNQTTVGCAGGNAKYNYTIVRNKSFTDTNSLGFSSACYATAPAYNSADFASQCSAFANYASGSGCTYGAPTSTGGTCGAGKSQYSIVGSTTVTTAIPSGTYDTTGKGNNLNLDDWARCLYQKGVPVSNGINQIASVYTIDVYNAQQNNDHTSLLLSAAHQGGGKYFAATNEGALLNSLKQIFAEIQSVNSTFASASLPVNATNRAQNENQVFIGMFRPDPSSQPRWFGNLKRYQLVLDSDGVSVNLGDKNGEIAVNNQTGFISDCATSFWTTDSPIDTDDPSKGYFWSEVVTNPDAASDCVAVGASAAYSDLPDGPTVEKGAVAEVIRKGNEPTGTDSSPTWSVNRTIYTTQSAFDTGLTPLTGFDGLSTDQKNWVRGVDNYLPNEHPSLNIRPSVHGDVVHSRPLPVTYGAGDGVVFYGANDGMFRAVDSETGKELWAIMPFEFAQTSFVDRLRNNQPLIRYPTTDLTITPTPIPKSYGWDGSIGISQNLDNSKVWIYPTMRRGGQMVYGMDVTTKTLPAILWKNGCYNGSCSNGFENIGQTWSAPVVAPVAAYTTEKIAIFGGGYDTCEDADTPQPPCASPRGANVYVVDAGSGDLLNTFTTERSVVSEVSMADMNNDGKADYAYVGDTGGNLYRIDMVTLTKTDNVATYSARPVADWTIHKIATAGEGRKFMFQPALLPLGRDGRVYVALGSGDREHPLQSNYPFSSVTNRFYVYLDDLAVSTTADLNALIDRTVDTGCEASLVLTSSVQPGWFMDLNQYGPGEQTVTSALILAGQVVFSTNRPIPPATGTCSTVLGEARGYWVNLLSGSGTIGSGQNSCGGIRSSIFVGGGLPPSPVAGRVLINEKPVSVVIGAVDRTGGASTPISPNRVVPSVKQLRKRLYHKQKGVD